jgi:signal transduction histidine kinase
LSEELDDLSITLQRSVLRIVQEALTNVHRHARATAVTIEGAVRRGALTVSVLDNGGGFGRVATPSEPTGVGIPGMKARVRHFGGMLKIRTGKKGTRVFARIPLHRGSAAGRTGRPAARDKRERAAAAAMTLVAK